MVWLDKWLVQVRVRIQFRSSFCQALPLCSDASPKVQDGFLIGFC